MESSRCLLRLVLVVLLVAGAGSTTLAATINVPADYATIQAAINAAANRDVVIVAPGTYKENIDFKGKAIVVRSTKPGDRAVVAATVIDGDQKGSVATFNSGETTTTALRGFTITNGTGHAVFTSPSAYYYAGGGVYCDANSSPALTSNVISGSKADCGGGVYCNLGSQPTLTNNTIIGNSATYGGGVFCNFVSAPTLTSNAIGANSASYGGGVCCINGSSPPLTKNTISGNTALSAGGGVYCNADSSPALASNTINGNRAGSGGGVHCGLACSPTLTNNAIRANTGTFGGGVYCDASSATLVGNTISGNTADQGGGVGCHGSAPALTSNTISRNAADQGGGVGCDYSSPALTGNAICGNTAFSGGGVYCGPASSPPMINNTISGNAAASGGGVFCTYASSSPVLKNTIVAFNTEGGGLYVNIDYVGSSPVVTYCDFYSNIGGNFVNWPNQVGKNGNISKNPLFANVARNDFHLRSTGGRWDPTTKTWVVDTLHSGCIDRGDPASAFGNEPAPNGGRINMGAYGNTQYASKSAPPTAGGGQVLVTATAIPTASGVAQITVNLTADASVQVSILNVAGREVATLPEQSLEAGVSSLLWNGRSSLGTKAPSGRYLVRVTARGEDGGQAQALAGLSLSR